MSALPPKADIDWRSPNVRFVPITEVGTTCVHKQLDMANDIKTTRFTANLPIADVLVGTVQ
jgi:hypothetical protein